MTESLSTSSKPPPLSDVPVSFKINQKNPKDESFISEDSHGYTNSDFHEFPLRSPESNYGIAIPSFNSHDGVFNKDGKMGNSEKYLSKRSLGKVVEDQVLEKQRKQREENRSDTGIDDNNNGVIEKEKSEKSENINQSQRRVSRTIGPEQLKILEQQIKEKELLRKDVLEIKSQITRKSLFIFNSSSVFRQKQIRLAESKIFSLIILAMTIVNITAICLQDFSHRIEEEAHKSYIGSALSFYLELACNIFFFIVFLIRVVAFGFVCGNRTYLRNGSNLLSFFIILGTGLIYIPNEKCQMVGKIIRCLRPIEILQEVTPLKKTANAFITTLFTISDKLVPIIFVLVFAAIFGLHIFNGLLESRCRIYDNPVNGSWPVNPEVTDLCGSIACPADNYCKNPTSLNFPENHTEMDIKELNYGLANYDNILMAFLTNMSFFTFTGWSSINDIFATAFNKIVVSLYSIGLLLILGLVFMNLLMAALYDGFMKNRQGIKAHINVEEKESDNNVIEKKLSPKLRSIVSMNCGNDANHEKRKKSETANNEVDVESSPMIKRILQNHKKNSKHVNNPKISHDPIKFSEINFNYPHFTIEYKLNPKSNILITFAHNIINSKIVNYTILLCLIVNIVTIAMERIDMSDNEKTITNIINFSCTIIFFIEISFRLLVLGPKKYWHNHFDKMDLVIIWMNMGDIIYLSLTGKDLLYNESSYTSIIKCLKTLRIFRFLIGMQFWRRGSILFIEMIKALVKTKEFIVLILISIFVGALMGMEFFAYRIRYIGEDEIAEELSLGHPPRMNYDDIESALMTTTMICLNEEWHIIMYEHMRLVGSKAGVYFIIVLLIGEVILIRMFMALFINGVIHSENIKNLLRTENSMKQVIHSIFNFKTKKEIQEKLRKIITIWIKPKELQPIHENVEIITNGNPSSLVENPFKAEIAKKMTMSQRIHNSPSNNRLTAYKEELIIPKVKDGFFIWFRSVCKAIVTHRSFEKVILGTILISVIFLTLHRPLRSPDDLVNKMQIVVDVIVIVFYFVEIAMKVSAYGLLFTGPEAFLLDPWNCFDLFLFVLTVLGTIDSQSPFSGINFKWCRIFRIFKIIKLAKGLKDATNILFKSIPDLISLTFYYFMNLFVFGIIAVNYLKGVFYYCDSLEEEFVELVSTREDCFDYGGDWINHDLNFDNILFSLSTLFQISTTEGWVEEMFNGIDFVGVEKNPIKDNHQIMALFYITFFIIANLIVINMFIGILVETYLHQKNMKSPFGHLTDEQKEWAYIKESIYKMKPKKSKQLPKNRVRFYCHNFTKGRVFRNIITSFNVLNIITFMLYYHRQPIEMENALNYINIIIIAIFSFELILRIIAQSWRFFTKFWNLFDLFIVGFSWLGNILLFFMGWDHYRWVKSLVNCIQVLRVARTIKSFKALNKLFYTVIQIIPQIANIAFLLLLFLISYSVIGVEFFAYLKPQQTAGNEQLNFHTFFDAFMNLIRSVTVEQWFKILNDCARTEQPNFTCRSVKNYDDYLKYGLQNCGSSVAYPYFFSFHIIISLLVVNLFIAMIMNTYDEIMKVEHSAINVFQLKEILVLWKEFDPEGLGFINYRDFNRFFKKMAIQLGVKYEDFMEVKNRRDFLRLLNLPLYENTNLKLFCYRFHDVIISLAQIAVLFNYGNMELEPEEGIPYFAKYEMKLLSDKRFNITNYKSSEVIDFQIIMKYLKKLKLRKYGKGTSNILFDLFDVTNKLKAELALIKRGENLTPTPASPKNGPRRKGSKNKVLRSDSKKNSYIELNNKVFGGMFLQHTTSKDRNESKS